MVMPMHLELLCSEYWMASETEEDVWPDSASCRFRMNQSRYSMSRDMKVPPIRINSTLSVECPSFCSWSTRLFVCRNGS